MTQPTAPEPCKLMTLHVGPTDCLDGECDEYATEDGDWAGRTDPCSHVRLADYCETHSTPSDVGTEWEGYDPAEPWPCQYDTTRTDVPAEVAR